MDMYEELCKSILKVIGGRDNIESASHCATRLRLTLKDLSIVGSDNDIKSIKGVLGLVKINKSYQIIRIISELGDINIFDDIRTI